MVPAASIIVWLSLSCLLTYVLIAFYINLRLNYHSYYYYYPDPKKYSSVRKENPKPNFSMTEHHLIWATLLEMMLHIAYWSFAYHVRDTLSLYTFELQIIYSLLTFVPLLTSLQFYFSYLEKSESTRQKLSLAFSGILLLYIASCAVINSEYISDSKEGFRIPALVLNSCLLIMAILITISACRNVYTNVMVFRKYKKRINSQMQEIDYYQE
jgi:hypothetical protein